MANWADVQRIASGLPETEESAARGTLAWRVRKALYAWERPLRRGDLAALGLASQDAPVLAARVPDLGVRAALIADDPAVYFATPHFDGYPAVLVWLDRIDVAELEELLTEAWLARAPARLARGFTAG